MIETRRNKENDVSNETSTKPRNFPTDHFFGDRCVDRFSALRCYVSSPVVAAVIVPDGWAGGLLHDSSTTWNFRIRNVGESGLDDNLFSYPFPAMGPSSGFNVPGLTGHQYTEVSILAVRHWLVIALLIASHAVLRLLLWRRLALDKRHETATNAT